MAYTPTGPFLNGSAPGINHVFLNAMETYLVSINSSATDGNVSANGSGRVTLSSIAATSAVTVTGTTAGTAVAYQFLQGPVKGLILHRNGYRNASTTEQVATLPVAFTSRSLFWCGSIQPTHIYNGGSVIGSTNFEIVTGFPTPPGAGGVTARSEINGFEWGNIVSGFTGIGLGTSQATANTSVLFIIGI